jgi:hypothetical protein
MGRVTGCRWQVAGLMCCALMGTAAAGARAAAPVLTPDAPPIAFGPAADARNEMAAALATDGGLELVSSKSVETLFTAFSTLKLQRFAGDGTAVGGPAAASQASDRDQLSPAIAPLAAGGFVVAWAARVPPPYPVDPGSLGHGVLMGRLLDRSGQPLGSDLQLGIEDDAATEVHLAPLGGGGFVASWTKARSGRMVVFRRFDSAARPLSDEVPLSNPAFARNLGLVPLADGGFVAAWGQSSLGVFLRRFDAAGAAVGGRGAAASQAVADDFGGETRLAASPSGRLALAWMTTNPDISKRTAVEVATFDADGNPLTPAVTVTASNGVFYPILAALDIDLRGRVVVSWTLWYSLGSSAGYAQLYEATGEPLGSPTLLPGHSYQVQPEQIFAGNDGGWSILFLGDSGQALQHFRTAGCSPAATSLCLAGDRFRLDATFGAGSHSATAHPVPLTSDTGALWFFDQANPELVVKILDGTAVNGHHWLFYGSLTDVEFDLTVTDTTTGQQRLYHNPAGTLASLADTRSFPPPGGAAAGAGAEARSGDTRAFPPPGSAAAAGAEAESPPASGPAAADLPQPALARSAPATAAAGFCHGEAARLCLTGGRFSATVSWRDPRAGALAASQAVQLSSSGGYFWFFGPDDVELSVKVLDGTTLNGHFWVFYASLTDVEFDLTVTDNLSPTGAARTYHNPAHHLASAADTSAF